MTRKILVTAALPYVNNVPHIGNLIGSTLSADVFARFSRSQGYETLYVCGTDEHGTATETKALAEGITPKELCDRFFEIHKKIYDWFGISFDIFGRTSDQKQTEVTQQIYAALNEQGYIFEQELEQLYSEKDGMFLADRYVLGTCPKCSSPDARGDQCDNCGALLTPTELINPKSAISGDTPVLRKTKHLFIDLAKLQPALTSWLEGKKFTDNTMRTTAAWLERGLEARAITRDLKWGVPVPRKGYENKVFYVWFDAPIGYISMTSAAITPLGSGDKAINYWWHEEDKQNRNTELYQFIGKDNIPFHSVLFPAMLLGTKENWTTVKHISTTEFLNYEDTKFSKSKGVGVFGDSIMEIEFSADEWRYYLLTNRPEQADTKFNWDDFRSKINGELVANLGNLVNRTLSFIKQYYEAKIPSPDTIQSSMSEKQKTEMKKAQEEFWKEAWELTEKVRADLESVKLKDALHNAMRLSMIGNAYFQRSEPWRTRTENPRAAAATINTLANFLVSLAVVIEPFMPRTSKAIAAQLNTTLPKWSEMKYPLNTVSGGHSIGEPKILFQKLDDKRTAELREKFSGGQKEQAARAEKNKQTTANEKTHVNNSKKRIQLVVGKILSVEKHPQADKLYVEQISLGALGTRNIVSGLAGHYKLEELEGKHVVVVANLAPAKLRGVMSEGMLLAAEEDGEVGIIITDAQEGTPVLSKDENDDEYEQITFEDFSKVLFEQREDGLYRDGKILSANGNSLVTDRGVLGKVR